MRRLARGRAAARTTRGCPAAPNGRSSSRCAARGCPAAPNGRSSSHCTARCPAGTAEHPTRPRALEGSINRIEASIRESRARTFGELVVADATAGAHQHGDRKEEVPVQSGTAGSSQAGSFTLCAARGSSKPRAFLRRNRGSRRFCDMSLLCVGLQVPDPKIEPRAGKGLLDLTLVRETPGQAACPGIGPDTEWVSEEERQDVAGEGFYPDDHPRKSACRERAEGRSPRPLSQYRQSTV